MTAKEPADPARMEIKGLMLDPSSSVPVVLLRDEETHLLLPIWIGAAEAHAIAQQLEGIQPVRPMTHDLLRNTLEALGASVEKIVISDLRDNTFFAEIHLVRDGRPILIDSRPSDAIALALRTSAPIFAQRAVLDRAEAFDPDSKASDEERIRKALEEMGPEDLGKYKM